MLAQNLLVFDTQKKSVQRNSFLDLRHSNRESSWPKMEHNIAIAQCSSPLLCDFRHHPLTLVPTQSAKQSAAKGKFARAT